MERRKEDIRLYPFFQSSAANRFVKKHSMTEADVFRTALVWTIFFAELKAERMPSRVLGLCLCQIEYSSVDVAI
jgi:hypothetical protein